MHMLRHIAAFTIAAIISTGAAAKDSPYYRWIEYDAPIATPSGPIDMKAGERSLADFKGQAVLLNLWATWCVPCLKELPTLDKLEKDWGEKGLVVLPLSLDSKPYAEVRKFLDERKLELPHLAIEKGEVAGKLKWNALPMTFLIGREGKIIGHYAGATDWTDAKHVPYLEKALKRKSGK